MLIKIEKADKYEADTMKDIEDDYDSLIGNLVLLKDEDVLYIVFPKDDGVGKLVEI